MYYHPRNVGGPLRPLSEELSTEEGGECIVRKFRIGTLRASSFSGLDEEESERRDSRRQALA